MFDHHKSPLTCKLKRLLGSISRLQTFSLTHKRSVTSFTLHTLNWLRTGYCNYGCKIKVCDKTSIINCLQTPGYSKEVFDCFCLVMCIFVGFVKRDCTFKIELQVAYPWALGSKHQANWWASWLGTGYWSHSLYKFVQLYDSGKQTISCNHQHS